MTILGVISGHHDMTVNDLANDCIMTIDNSKVLCRYKNISRSKVFIVVVGHQSRAELCWGRGTGGMKHEQGR